ncbi:MAG: hypothetical protein HUJ97_09460, partial [Bacteroidales bacterium]|nr:hypothetical protein [Bacteroidales bacterium]
NKAKYNEKFHPIHSPYVINYGKCTDNERDANPHIRDRDTANVKLKQREFGLNYYIFGNV